MSNNGPNAIVPGGRGAQDSDNIPNNSGGNSKSRTPDHFNHPQSKYGNFGVNDTAPSAEDQADVKSGA